MTSKTSLKVMLLNAENLFLLSDSELNADHLKLDPIQWNKLSTSIYPNKPLSKLFGIQKAILAHQPDLIMLCEVGGLESLNNFNQLFLMNAYSPALVEGNSNRHIDIGFLAKKDLGFYFDLLSNKNRPLNFSYTIPPEEFDRLGEAEKKQVSEKFSRDASELHFFLKDRNEPFLIFVLAHLKSRLDPENIDPNGFLRRCAELKSLIDIYLDLENKFNYQVPIAICGDFNGNAQMQNPDEEFRPLYDRTALKDVCELAQLPLDQRATYYQVNRGGRTEGRQIDYCFLSPKLAHHLDQKSVQIHRYTDEMGLPFDPPTTLDAKAQLPSDHFPMVFQLIDIPVR